MSFACIVVVAHVTENAFIPGMGSTDEDSLRILTTSTLAIAPKRLAVIAQPSLRVFSVSTSRRRLSSEVSNCFGPLAAGRK